MHLSILPSTYTGYNDWYVLQIRPTYHGTYKQASDKISPLEHLLRSLKSIPEHEKAMHVFLGFEHQDIHQRF